MADRAGAEEMARKLQAQGINVEVARRGGGSGETAWGVRVADAPTTATVYTRPGNLPRTWREAFKKN